MAEKTVLVCPLDWGLGHASRCIPVINAFSNAGCRVIAACSGPAADLVREETSATCQVVPFPGFTISYSRYWLLGGLLLQMPSFLYHVAKEKMTLKFLVEKHRPDLIVSDNRYGLVHDSVPSVLITHQLKPSLPVLFGMLEKPLSGLIRKWAMAFDECWIPDHPGNSAAGLLISGWENLPGARFIGWLSRLPGKPENGGFYSGSEETGPKDDSPEGERKSFRYDVMFLLSGPEPHRSELEKKVTEGCVNSGISALIARGLPGIPHKVEVRGNTEIIPFLPTAGLARAFGDSRLVVCRSGYSSVMDLLVAGKNAILIPTPGQPEQEYLGEWLGGRGWFRVINQKDFDIGMVMERLRPEDHSFKGSRTATEEDLLQKSVNEVVRRYT